MTDLDPIEPRRAVELYLEHKKTEYAASTVQSHESRLKFFLKWCAENGIENMNTLTGRDLYAYRVWRKNEGGLNRVSLKAALATLRAFIRFCESIEGVEQDLHLKVQLPQLSKNENVRDTMLKAEDAEAILAHLQKFEYASRDHVTLELLWHTALRTGSLRALDVEDYYPEEQYLELIHRPDTETPLKNKADGERLVALSDRICTILDDWIETKRTDVTDEYGRNPLVTTRQGRISPSAVRNASNHATQPCLYGDSCPHARDLDECEARQNVHKHSCPSSRSPHAVRRGAITNMLNDDMPDKAVADRTNVSAGVLDKHYDRRTQEEKMEQRRRYLD